MTKIEKVATQIADRVIAGLKDNNEFQRRLREADQARESEGKDALGALRRLGGKKLPAGEEVIIARRLYPAVQVLKQHLRAQKSSIGKFCIDAKIADASQSSKELHRLTLAPGKNPDDVRLRRTADKYYRLIMAISKTTRESASTLADRLLIGTSLHPAKNLWNLSEVEMVQTALQGIVDRIDSEFSIFAKFMEVAELKSRHIANGGKTNWPKADWFLEPDWIDSEQELADAMNPDFAFWQRERLPVQTDPSEMEDVTDERFNELGWTQEENDDFLKQESTSPRFPVNCDSGVFQDKNFFYIPHTPIGMVDYSNLRDPKKDLIGYEKSVDMIIRGWRKPYEPSMKSSMELSLTISDQWNAETNQPFGQTLDGNDGSVSADYAWIVIYPMPDNARLMPMLYIPQEEGGALLAPLDARNLDIFRDAIWADETRHLSVFDRIKELLGYRPGTSRVIEDGLRRTAPWLDHNPFFKMRDQKTEDLRLLGDFCQQYWAPDHCESVPQGGTK